ncbi:hypothetical protein VDGL01_04007 [Verticillium dahliae]
MGRPSRQAARQWGRHGTPACAAPATGSIMAMREAAFLALLLTAVPSSSAVRVRHNDQTRNRRKNEMRAFGEKARTPPRHLHQEQGSGLSFPDSPTPPRHDFPSS